MGKIFEKSKSALDTLTCPLTLMISVGLLYWLTMPKTLSWGWRGYGIDETSSIWLGAMRRLYWKSRGAVLITPILKSITINFDDIQIELQIADVYEHLGIFTLAD